RLAAGLVDVPVKLAPPEQAEERVPAEKAAEVPLFVAEHRHVDADLAGRGVRGDGTRGLQRIDAPQGPVEPAGMVLALQMRAGEDLAAGCRALAEDIADAVDRGNEFGLRQSTPEPFPGRDVLLGEGRGGCAALVSPRRRRGAHARDHPPPLA